MSVFMQRCRRTGAWAEDCGGNFACDNACDLEEVEVGRLDDLARDFPPGTIVRVRTGESARNMTVLGVSWSLPLEPGGPDEPALVTRDRLGVGSVYLDEVVWSSNEMRGLA